MDFSLCFFDIYYLAKRINQLIFDSSVYSLGFSVIIGIARLSHTAGDIMLVQHLDIAMATLIHRSFREEGKMIQPNLNYGHCELDF